MLIVEVVRYNRTYVELKDEPWNEEIKVWERYNRTYVELKVRLLCLLGALDLVIIVLM